MSAVELTQWLQEAGKRPPPSAASPHPEEILSYIETRVGVRLRCFEDVDIFLRAQREQEQTRVRRRIVRGTVLLLSLAASYLHYYYWDVQLQIASIRPVVLIPADNHRTFKS